MAAGLAAIAPHAEAAYVTSCDVPLLEPAFVQAMIDRLAEHDVAVPVQGPLPHPLAAVYRTSVLPTIQARLTEDCLRLTSVLAHVRAARVPVEDLQLVDPPLHTLRNVNQPADYFSALAVAGLAADASLARMLRPKAETHPRS